MKKPKLNWLRRGCCAEFLSGQKQALAGRICAVAQQKREMVVTRVMMSVTIMGMVFRVKRALVTRRLIDITLTSEGHWAKLSRDAICSANLGLLLRLLSVRRDGRELCL